MLMRSRRILVNPDTSEVTYIFLSPLFKSRDGYDTSSREQKPVDWLRRDTLVAVEGTLIRTN